MTGTSFFPVPSSALRWDDTGRIHQQSRAVSMGKSFKYFPLTLPESCCLWTPECPSIILPISIVLLDLSVPLSMTGVPLLQQGLQGIAPSQSSLSVCQVVAHTAQTVKYCNHHPLFSGIGRTSQHVLGNCYSKCSQVITLKIAILIIINIFIWNKWKI